MARYDAVADWYEREFSEAPVVRDAAVRLLGAGRGRLIDVACGVGSHDQAFAELGWAVTGVDESAEQLRYARERGVHAVQADAAALPFGDAAFDAAICIWLHTDTDDFAGILREIRRVLHPGAPFVYIGGHPCFVGPHARFIRARGVPELHPGYDSPGPYHDAPGINPEGLRAKVGAFHLPLQDFLTAFLDAGFSLERFEELGLDLYPYMVATRWR